MADDAKGVRVVDVDLPEMLQPGDRATARIDVENNTLFPSPWDEDRCVGEHAGAKVEGVVVGPNGQEFVGDTECVLSAAPLGGRDRKTSEVTFTAPDTEGSHRYEAFARLAVSGEETGRRSKRIDVFTDSSDAPEEAPPDNGGSEWWDLPNNDDPNPGPNVPNPLADITGDVQLVAGLILLIALLYSAGQLASFNVGAAS